MSNLKGYRACFVPLCTNTTKTTPLKMFLHVPHDVKRRNKWFQAVRRSNPKTSSNFFCCEDHFDLKEDMENYFYYTTMGGKAKIKVDVVPHKFNCDPNRKRQGNTTLRPVAEKRRKQQMIQEILTEPSKNIGINTSQESNIETISVDSVDRIEIDSAPLNITSAESVSIEKQTDSEKRTVGVQVNYRPKYRSVAVQVNYRPKYRSVSVQCKFDDKSCSSSKTGNISIATSPIKSLHQNSNLLEAHESVSSNSFTHSNSSQDIYEPLENTGSSTIDSSSLQSPVKKEILKCCDTPQLQLSDEKQKWPSYSASEISANSPNCLEPQDIKDIEIKDEPLDIGKNAYDNISQNQITNIDALSGSVSNDTEEANCSSNITEQNNEKIVEGLINALPEIGNYFDIPEYVAINNVSFENMTFLYQTSVKTKPTNTKYVKKKKIDDINKLQKVQLIPVDQTNKHQVKKLKINDGTGIKSIPSDAENDMCLPVTKLNSGIYINDHDYLTNPYKRNNVRTYRRSSDVEVLSNSAHISKGVCVKDTTKTYSIKQEPEDLEDNPSYKSKLNIIQNGTMPTEMRRQKYSTSDSVDLTITEQGDKAKAPLNDVQEIDDDSTVDLCNTEPFRGFTSSSEQFKLYFRMNRSTFQHIMGKLKYLYCYADLEKELLICLWYMGTTESLKSVVTRFNSVPFNWTTLLNMSYFIEHINKQDGIISWPSEEQANNIMNEFEKISGIPGIIGCVKGYHIKIPLCKNAKVYSHSKMYHSVYLQGVCDNRKLFTDVYVSHTDTLFSESPLGHKNYKYLFPNDSHIVGTKDFKLEKYLMVNYTKNLNSQKKAFNQKLSQTSTVVNEAFALLRGRFIRLKFMDTRKVDVILAITKMACILHNICIQKEDKPHELLNLEKELHALHQDYIDPGPIDQNNITVEAKRKRDSLMASCFN